jgi:hypothetical protein
MRQNRTIPPHFRQRKTPLTGKDLAGLWKERLCRAKPPPWNIRAGPGPLDRDYAVSIRPDVSEPRRLDSLDLLCPTKFAACRFLLPGHVCSSRSRTWELLGQFCANAMPC